MLSMVFSRAGLSEVLTFPSQIPKRSLPLTAAGMRSWTSLGELTDAESWSARLSAMPWFLTKALILWVCPPLLSEGSKRANPAPRSLPLYFMQAIPVSGVEVRDLRGAVLPDHPEDAAAVLVDGLPEPRVVGRILAQIV